jgi:alkylation response protein AidB-like acyl-CoA dehydrogenase
MIDLLPSTEQEQLAESIARFLGDTLPADRFRNPARKPDQALWGQLAELGCFGLSSPEGLGGAGYGLTEEILAFREYGRHLVTPSVLATVLAARLAASAGDEALAGRLMRDEARAALAVPMAGASLGADGGASGAFHLIDATEGDLLIAWTDEQAALYAAGSFGVAAPQLSLDRTAPLTRAEVSRVQPLLTSPANDGGRTDLEAAVLIAAAQVGMTEAVLALAVEHAKTRVQFGHPIGVFQGVKHKCADMAMAVESAWSQTIYAALALSAGASDARFHALTAKLVASEAAVAAARDCIQIHGGMGFTAEVDAHLFLKRAHVLALVGLDNRSIKARLLDLPLAS